jgi:hypothetical protein
MKEWLAGSSCLPERFGAYCRVKGNGGQFPNNCNACRLLSTGCGSVVVSGCAMGRVLCFALNLPYYIMQQVGIFFSFLERKTFEGGLLTVGG